MSSPGPRADPTTPNSDEVLQRDHDSGWILPEPDEREAMHTRSIVCRGFKRADGLVDIEGRFIDTRTFAFENDWRGRCPAGSAVHHMQLRLTVDKQRIIRKLVSAMPTTPYATCPEINTSFQKLLGVSLGRGFRKAVRERIGGVGGCTHIIALLETMAASAVQTFTSISNEARERGIPKPIKLGAIEVLVDTCYAYRDDGPVVAEKRRIERAHATK